MIMVWTKTIELGRIIKGYLYNDVNCTYSWRLLPSRTSGENSHRHGDVIKWKQFPRYWPFVQGIHRSLVNYPHKGQWRGALMFYFICVWVNNRQAGDLRRHRAHYDVIVISGLHPVTIMARHGLSQTNRYLVYKYIRINAIEIRSIIMMTNLLK